LELPPEIDYVSDLDPQRNHKILVSASCWIVTGPSPGGAAAGASGSDRGARPVLLGPGPEEGEQADREGQGENRASERRFLHSRGILSLRRIRRCPTPPRGGAVCPRTTTYPASLCKHVCQRKSLIC